MFRKLVVALMAVFMSAGFACAEGKAKNPVVRMETSQGTIKLIFYSWFLKVILYQHITRCKKSLGTTVAAL